MTTLINSIFQIIKQFLFFLLVFVFTLILFSFFSATIEKVSAKSIEYIKVNELSFVKDAEIYLEDVAEIYVSGKDKDFFSKGIRIGKAALPGNSRDFRGEYIKNLIKRKIGNSIKLIVPQNIKVVSKVKLISSDFVKKEFLIFLKKSKVWKDRCLEDCALILDEELMLKPISIPDRNVDFEFIISSTDDLLGPTNVKLVISDGKDILKKMWFRVNIAFKGNIVVAQKTLRPGDVIEEDMVKLQNIKIDDVSDEFFTNIKAVLSKRVKVYIRENFAITGKNVENPPLVNFGDLVDLVASNGAIEINSKAKSYERGYKGSVIRVQNLMSKKYVSAEVVGVKKVMVKF